MQRDMDLARAILLYLEKCPYTGGWHEVKINGHPPEEIWYHIKLLSEARFVDAEQVNAAEWKAKEITWDGHEFLGSSRDETRWEKAKKLVIEKGGPLTLAAINTALTELVKGLF